MEHLGKTFGDRTVIEVFQEAPGRRKSFKCRCVCGSIDIIHAYLILAGKRGSCKRCMLRRSRKSVGRHGIENKLKEQSND